MSAGPLARIRECRVDETAQPFPAPGAVARVRRLARRREDLPPDLRELADQLVEITAQFELPSRVVIDAALRVASRFAAEGRDPEWVARNGGPMFAYELQWLSRRVGSRRATALLRSLLSPSQDAELSRSGRFHVESASGTLYRVTPRRDGPTDRVEARPGGLRPTWHYCLHGDGLMPSADLAAAHLLLIASDEDAFLREANATPTRWADPAEALGWAVAAVPGPEPMSLAARGWLVTHGHRDRVPA